MWKHRTQIKQILFVLLQVLSAALLAGCSSRASANITINPDSTIVMEELILLEKTKELDFNIAPYNQLIPGNSEFYAESRQETREIDGHEYTGCYTRTRELTVNDYNTFISNVNDYQFKPRIQIVPGRPFMKKAKIDIKGQLDAIRSMGYSINNASMIVNISVPGTILQSNHTRTDPSTGACIWENEDINDISITFEYLDLSGPFKTVLTILVLISFYTFAFILVMAFTKPEKHSFY